MKILIVTTFIFCLFNYNSWSQELKVSSGYGYATVETKVSKGITTNKNLMVGGEFDIRPNLKFTTGIIHNLLTGNRNDAASSSTFKSDYFIIVPISIKLYVPLTTKSKAFAEFGFYPSYYFLEKSEYFVNGNKHIIKESNIGYNFGAHANIGVKTDINAKWAYDISIGGQEDVLFSYNKEAKKIDANRWALNFSLYKKRIK